MLVCRPVVSDARFAIRQLYGDTLESDQQCSSSAANALFVTLGDSDGTSVRRIRSIFYVFDSQCIAELLVHRRYRRSSHLVYP